MEIYAQFGRIFDLKVQVATDKILSRLMSNCLGTSSKFGNSLHNAVVKCRAVMLVVIQKQVLY